MNEHKLLMKKKLIVLFFIIIIGVIFFILKQKNETNVSIKTEQIGVKMILPEIMEEIIISTEENCGNFYQDTKGVIDTRSYRNKNNFSWIIEEDVFLIHGNLYYFNFINADINIREEEITCLHKTLKDYLFENGFSYNYENSYSELGEAFEKGDIKIAIDTNSSFSSIVYFGDINIKSEIKKITRKDFVEIFTILNLNENTIDDELGKIRPTIRGMIGRNIGDFLEILMPRTRVIFKKDSDSWRFLTYVAPDSPPCDPIFQENIPPELVDYACWSGDGHAPLLEYNKESNSWE